MICTKELSVCSSSLQTCTTERDRLIEYLNKLKHALSQCNDALAICKKNLLQTNDNIKFTSAEIEKLQPIYNRCQIDLEECRKKLAALITSKDALTNLISDTLKDKSECSITDVQIDSIDKEIKERLDLCKMDIDRKNVYAEAVRRVGEKKFEESNKQLAVCRNNFGTPTTFSMGKVPFDPNSIPPITFKKEIRTYPFVGDPWWSGQLNPDGDNVGIDQCRQMCIDNSECTHFHVGEGRCWLKKPDNDGNIGFRHEGGGHFFFEDPMYPSRTIEVPYVGQPLDKSLNYHKSKIGIVNANKENCRKYCKDDMKAKGYWYRRYKDNKFNLPTIVSIPGITSSSDYCQCFADYQNITFQNEVQSGEFVVRGSAPPDYHQGFDSLVN